MAFDHLSSTVAPVVAVSTDSPSSSSNATDVDAKGANGAKVSASNLLDMLRQRATLIATILLLLSSCIAFVAGCLVLTTSQHAKENVWVKNDTQAVVNTFATKQDYLNYRTFVQDHLSTALNTSIWVPGSPSWRALQWIITHDPPRYYINDDINTIDSSVPYRLLQRYVLVHLYFMWGGHTWEVQDFLSKPDECDWWGITCDNSTRIINLNWTTPDVSFKGQVPTELGLLTSLESLTLIGPDLRGSIPIELARLKALKLLDLSRNYVVLDSTIGMMTHLQELRLSVNKWMGEIPTELALLTGLRGLYLDRSEHLTGNVLEMMLKWPMLEYLDISVTSLMGSLPTEIGDLTHLKRLAAYASNYTGSIPTEIGKCSLIDVLNINNPTNSKGFVGSVPTEIGRLTKLEILALFENSLTSTVPTEIGQLTDLYLLNFMDNRDLTGSIPTEFGRLSNIQVFHFSQTSMTGSLPTQFIGLTNINEITIYKTDIDERVPEAICESIVGNVVVGCGDASNETVGEECSCCERYCSQSY
jgi:Leucine-rich repeat (LRR) protein